MLSTKKLNSFQRFGLELIGIAVALLLAHRGSPHKRIVLA